MAIIACSRQAYSLVLLASAVDGRILRQISRDEEKPEGHENGEKTHCEGERSAVPQAVPPAADVVENQPHLSAVALHVAQIGLGLVRRDRPGHAVDYDDLVRPGEVRAVVRPCVDPAGEGEA